MSATANRVNTIHLLPRLLTSEERNQLRLDRLRELRATIESLRLEQAAHDPLLAWVVDPQRPWSSDA